MYHVYFIVGNFEYEFLKDNDVVIAISSLDSIQYMFIVKLIFAYGSILYSGSFIAKYGSFTG
jgi:hypothetical protein